MPKSFKIQQTASQSTVITDQSGHWRLLTESQWLGIEKENVQQQVDVNGITAERQQNFT